MRLNKNWGSVFHTTHPESGARDASLFGFALRRHADIYMSELQNIGSYAMRDHRFQPPSFTMPHEVTAFVDPCIEKIAGSKLVGAVALRQAEGIEPSSRAV